MTHHGTHKMRCALSIVLSMTIVFFISLPSSAQTKINNKKKAVATNAKKKNSTQKNTKIKLYWFEPKIEPATQKDSSIVHLYGLTQENMPIAIDFENIYVLKRTGSNTKVRPKGIQSAIKSDQNGRFELVFELPHGLSQVPILFNKYIDTKGIPLLLTIDVSSKNIKLNVKISERPEDKAKRLAEEEAQKAALAQAQTASKAEFATKFSAGLGFGLSDFSMTTKVDGVSTGLDVSSSDIVSPKIHASAEFENWWYKFSYEMASHESERYIDSLYVVTPDFSTSRLNLQVNYLLSSGARSFWLMSGVDYSSLPIFAVTALSTIETVDFSILRVIAGFGYKTETDSWLFESALALYHPIYLQVSSGEIEYSAKTTFLLSLDTYYKYTENWHIGAGVKYEMSSYDYDLTDTALSISNSSSVDYTSMSAHIMANYQF
jgi:hypothetical protein